MVMQKPFKLKLRVRFPSAILSKCIRYQEKKVQSSLLSFLWIPLLIFIVPPVHFFSVKFIVPPVHCASGSLCSAARNAYALRLSALGALSSGSCAFAYICWCVSMCVSTALGALSAAVHVREHSARRAFCCCYLHVREHIC
jgi:hypothetical protein